MKKFFEKLFGKVPSATSSEDVAVDTHAPELLSETNSEASQTFRAERALAANSLPQGKKNQVLHAFADEVFASPYPLLAQEGRSLALPQLFPVVEALEQLVSVLNAQEGIQATYLGAYPDGLHLVQFKDSTTFRRVLKLAPVFHFYVREEAALLTYALSIGTWFETLPDRPPSPKKVGLFNQFYVSAVQRYWKEIAEACVHQHVDIASADSEILAESFLMPSGHYVQNFELPHLFWVLTHLHSAQLGDVLAWLPVVFCKPFPTEVPEKSTSFFLLTSRKVALLSFSLQGECVWHTFLEAEQIHEADKKGAFQESIYTWEFAGKFLKLFEELRPALSDTSPTQRMERLALLNWHRKATESSSNEFALLLIQKKALLAPDSLDTLTAAYLATALHNRREAMRNFLSHTTMAQLTQEVLALEDLSEALPQWVAKWEVTLEDTLTFLQVLAQFAVTRTKIAPLLPYYRDLRAQFFAKHQPDYRNASILLFDLQFAQYLLAAGCFLEVRELLEELRTHLPDETLADLLPSPYADLSGATAGPPLKVRLLEMLMEAKHHENILGEIKELAMLQPLHKERLSQLLKMLHHTSLADRLKEVIHILAHDGMASYQHTTIEEDVLFQQVPSEVLKETLPHSAARNTGAFYKVQGWLASAPVTDYAHLKSYTERLGAQPYHQIYLNILADVLVAFGMDGVEAYIARGEKGVGIQAFEGAPSFIVMGNEHLDTKSVFFMQPAEIRFAFGAEIAHLYFKHTRLTAQDVWQGAWQKGKMVLDTLAMGALSVQLVSNTLQQTARLSNLLRQSERLGSLAAGTSELLQWLGDTVHLYKSADESEKLLRPQDELLATSRLLQLTADRSGLLMCGNLYAAIRAIFLTQRAFVAELPVAQRYGLSEIIGRQNEQGEYVFQHLAIRLASLIAFYLSDEYELLREQLCVEE